MEKPGQYVTSQDCPSICNGFQWKQPGTSSQSENLKERLNYVQTTQRGYEYTAKVQKQGSEQQKNFQNTKIESNRDTGLLQKIQIEMKKEKKKQTNKPKTNKPN